MNLSEDETKHLIESGALFDQNLKEENENQHHAFDGHWLTLYPQKSFQVPRDSEFILDFKDTFKGQQALQEIILGFQCNFHIQDIELDYHNPLRAKNTLALEIDHSCSAWLTTPEGTRSLYGLYDNKVIYLERVVTMNPEVLDIDPKNAQALDQYYVIDHEKVCFKGEILNISAKGFKVFDPGWNGFAGNAQQILYNAQPIDVKDPASFEAFSTGEFRSTGLGRDQYHLYQVSIFNRENIIVQECQNPETVEYFTAGLAACIHHVYIHGVPINYIHRPSWKHLAGLHSCDHARMYFGQSVIENADIHSFAVISGGYGRDKNQLFHENMLMNDIDNTTFEIIPPYHIVTGDARLANATMSSDWAKDKNRYYCGGTPCTKQDYHIGGVY